SREDPTAMPPRTDRVCRQPAPNGCPTDLRDKSLFDSFTSNFIDRKPGERQIELGGQFTSQGIHLHNNLRGKMLAYVRCEPDQPSHLCARRSNAVSTSRRSAVANQVAQQFRCWCSPDLPEG